MPIAPTLRRACISLAVFLAGGIMVLAQWAPALAVQFDADRLQRLAYQRYGARGSALVSEWMETLGKARALPELQQLRMVNAFWNSNVMGGEDIDIWGQTDYWATPLETLGRRAGDCEDYVIGKYFSLLYLGVPAERLRLIYVRARVGGQTIAHMVLGYYESPSSDPLILDSLTSTMARAGARRDLTPVFSFNAQALYVAGETRSVGGIRRWQDLLVRMRAEGIEP